MSTQHKMRLWYHIPSTCNDILQMQIEDNNPRLYNGRCSMVIISIYAFIQGFLSEIIDNELFFLRKSGVYSERLYQYFLNQNLTKGLEELLDRFRLIIDVDYTILNGYELIKNLTILRNNIAHGKGYNVEIEGRPNFPEEKKISIKNYNSVYRYLCNSGVIPERKNELSPIVFFDYKACIHFLFGARSFLFVLLKESNFNEKNEFEKLLTDAWNFENQNDGGVIQITL